MKFNLTSKRIEALRLISARPGIRCDTLADTVMPRLGRSGNVIGFTAQGATRTGAGYCIALEKAGLIKINTYMVRGGYGECFITDAGLDALAESDRKATEGDNTLDAVVSRCISKDVA